MGERGERARLQRGKRMGKKRGKKRGNKRETEKVWGRG